MEICMVVGMIVGFAVVMGFVAESVGVERIERVVFCLADATENIRLPWRLLLRAPAIVFNLGLLWAISMGPVVAGGGFGYLVGLAFGL